MNSKNHIETSVLAAGATDVKGPSAAIPNGETWIIRTFGAADINKGDSKSTVYILRFGTEIIRVLSLTGDTRELELKIDITGNGADKVNVVRRNESGYDKECAFWITAYKRA